jgi:enhancing lycopene biosynthesis protein 2
MKGVDGISLDKKNKIICAPCYMMEADILHIRENIKEAIDAMCELA